jgi:hypothetical protein
VMPENHESGKPIEPSEPSSPPTVLLAREHHQRLPGQSSTPAKPMAPATSLTGRSLDIAKGWRVKCPDARAAGSHAGGWANEATRDDAVTPAGLEALTVGGRLPECRISGNTIGPLPRRQTTHQQCFRAHFVA